jgi:arylsulfatase A-like enzyme
MKKRLVTRRNFLASASLASFASAKSLGCPPREKLPNIILILADDLGPFDLGCYGQRQILTPRIDRMASEGTRFTQCYGGSPVCAPSRNVLMTGRHTGHTRIRDNMPAVGGTIETFGEGGKRISLGASDQTVAEMLKRAGYATAIAGKWGLAEPDTDGVPNRRGFDQFLGYLNNNHASYYYTPYLWKNESQLPLEGNQHGGKKQYTHDLFTESALDYVRKHRDVPFFLYLAYTIPHENLEVPDLGDYAKQPWSDAAKTYAAMITRMDRDVGRLLDLLGQVGIERETMVLFASDNGAPRKEFTTQFRSNGALRGNKGQLYEGGIRVPMIVRWPGSVPAGKVSDVPWYFADFLPTAAALAGVRAVGSDGIDFSPLLTGRQKELPDRNLYWEYPNKGLQQAVRRGRWKALRTRPDGPLELYDLWNDPSEEKDVASVHPEVISGIEAYLATAHTESPNWPTVKPARKERR